MNFEFNSDQQQLYGEQWQHYSPTITVGGVTVSQTTIIQSRFRHRSGRTDIALEFFVNSWAGIPNNADVIVSYPVGVTNSVFRMEGALVGNDSGLLLLHAGFMQFLRFEQGPIPANTTASEVFAAQATFDRA